MNAPDDHGSKLIAQLVDLRHVPLAELHAESERAVGNVVNRVLREQSAYQVPVAAFNSSI
jgi:FXSXX-COOH protein